MRLRRDENYPFECAPGKFGGDTSRLAQSSPRCSGPCPQGKYCPLATIEPIECDFGTFCPEGSAVETNCPPGTYGAGRGQTDISQCQTCRAGTQCPVGSSEEIPCAPGSHAPAAGSVSCTACPPGSYQDATQQTSCKLCIPGHYCGVGSPSPTACPAGYYAPLSGLNTSSQCAVSMHFYVAQYYFTSSTSPSASMAIDPSGGLTAAAFDSLDSALCRRAFAGSTALRGPASPSRALRALRGPVRSSPRRASACRAWHRPRAHRARCHASTARRTFTSSLSLSLGGARASGACHAPLARAACATTAPHSSRASGRRPSC